MLDAAVDSVKQTFPDQVLAAETFRDQTTIEIRRDRVADVLRHLKDAHGMNCLMDLCGLDLLGRGAPERFAVVYHLKRIPEGSILRVKAYVPEADPWIDSVTSLWEAANWAEREAFDMFGIRFRGHPNLRRILLPETFGSHPLRKEYPLQGKGERDQFPKYYE